MTTKNTAKKTFANTPPPPAAPPAVHPELSTTHTMIIDAVAEMLTHGGDPDDVRRLLRATMGWRRRRTLTFDHHEPREQKAETDRYVEKFIDEDFENWRNDLVTAWRQNKRPEAPAFTPSTITDRIRENKREELRDQFQDFLRTGSPEEIHLMFETLSIRNGATLTAEDSRGEIYLAEAFGFMIQGSSAVYLKVPASMVKQTKNYVDALRAIARKDD